MGFAKNLAELRERQRKRLARLRRAAPGPGPHPIAPVQFGVWLHEQLRPGDYVIPLSLRLRGPIDEAALEATLKEIVRRHEPLRTTFHFKRGAVVQLVGSGEDIHLTRVETVGAGPSKAQFDLEKGPIVRFELARTGDDERLLRLHVHHLAWDHRSMGIFFRELEQIYGCSSRGEPSPLGELSLRYVDYATHEHEAFAAGEYRDAVEHWVRQLLDAPPSPELPRGCPTSGIRRTEHFDLELGPERTEKVRRAARAHGVSLFTLTFSLFNLLLARETGQTDLVTAVMMDDRSLPGARFLIGFFTNALAMRVNIPAEAPFTDVVARVEQVVHEGLMNGPIPLSAVAEAIESRRGRGAKRFALPTLFFSFLEDAGARTFQMGDAVAELVVLDQPYEEFEMAFRLRDRGAGGIIGKVSYRSDAFDQPTITTLVSSFLALIDDVLGPETR